MKTLALARLSKHFPFEASIQSAFNNNIANRSTPLIPAIVSSIILGMVAFMMSLQGYLYCWAAALLIALGIAHSVMGERYILMRLFKRTDLPKLFGSADFTTRTLRFAWHLTTITWWSIAALFIVMARAPITSTQVSLIFGVMMLASGIISLVASRGRHFSWVVFLLVAALLLYSVV